MSQIQSRYQLEINLLRLERQIAENNAALKQAKFDLRETNVAQAEYRGSFRFFRDKFTGKQEETETALCHAVQKAEASLSSAQQQQKSLEAQLQSLTEQLAALPDWESLNDGSQEWHRQEALYCLEVLHPLLEVTLDLLTQRRNQFNGTHAGQLKTRLELSDIYSAPEAAGEACMPWLGRLTAALDALEIPLELNGFFEAPTAFLSSATQYTRMDRINTAMAQVEALLRKFPQLRCACAP